MGRRAQPPIDRLRALTSIDERGCWVFSGFTDNDGYGRLKVDGKNVSAHRFSYEHYHGVCIPDGYVIDHKCFNPSCTNPNHLECVTPSENSKRARHPNKLKTHCVRGHPLEGDNLYLSKDNWRYCKACRAQAMKRYKTKEVSK